MSDKRNELIEAVEEGRLSPEDADAEAVRLGLKPLSYRPDPAEYDPSQDLYWTPVMAVAWIVWRTPNAVREMCASYVLQSRVWRLRRWPGKAGEVQKGYSLEQPARPSLEALHLIDVAPRAVGHERRTALVSLSEARDRVLHALQTGVLTATGVTLSGSGPRRVIPLVEWPDLEFAFEDTENQFRRRRSSEGDGYRDVLVRREQVVKLWKPTQPLAPNQLPTPVRPDGAGYMTLFHALLWIATAGGADIFAPGDAERWQTAFDALLPQIASGRIMLTGERDGQRVTIPPHAVAACRLDGPFADTPASFLFGTDLYLRCYLYIDEEHWLNGFDDALMVGQQERWARLMVPKEEVGKLWPFGLAVPTRSGAPGRPTSKQIIIDEYDRRKAAGVDVADLRQVASDLVQWLAITLPTAPRPGIETVRRSLRDLERQRAAVRSADGKQE